MAVRFDIDLREGDRLKLPCTLYADDPSAIPQSGSAVAAATKTVEAAGFRVSENLRDSPRKDLTGVLFRSAVRFGDDADSDEVAAFRIEVVERSDEFGWVIFGSQSETLNAGTYRYEIDYADAGQPFASLLEGRIFVAPQVAV